MGDSVIRERESNIYNLLKNCSYLLSLAQMCQKAGHLGRPVGNEVI